MLRVPITQAAMRLMEASKKSRPMWTRLNRLLRTISPAIACVSSSSSTTWSLSQRTGRLTCSSRRGTYSMALEILSEITSVGWKWPASRQSAVWRLVA
ncbi:hypothetical protein D3C75_1061690 [compost metagenome]